MGGNAIATASAELISANSICGVIRAKIQSELPYLLMRQVFGILNGNQIKKWIRERCIKKIA